LTGPYGGANGRNLGRPPLKLPSVDEFPAVPGFDDVVKARPIAGGNHGTTWLATREDGSAVVVKAGEHIPAGVFLAEAEGLAAMANTGSVATPAILDVGPRHLVLEALRPPPDADPAFWEEAGRAVADLHTNAGPAHGWHRDNWLGQLPQHNTWCSDGHEFFVRHRLMRYLEKRPVQTFLGSESLAEIERICSRIEALVPKMPPVLCHGDMWSGNFLATGDGRPAVIDPAVAFTWAEVDLSMMYCEHRPDERFFASYHEVHPPEPGWRDRLELLHLRELLSVLAHYGQWPELCIETVDRVAAVVEKFR
jgi:fructosamine-3-kinase